MERYYGNFVRSIQLPCDIEEEKISATYKKWCIKGSITKETRRKEKGN